MMFIDGKLKFDNKHALAYTQFYQFIYSIKTFRSSDLYNVGNNEQNEVWQVSTVLLCLQIIQHICSSLTDSRA